MNDPKALSKALSAKIPVENEESSVRIKAYPRHTPNIAERVAELLEALGVRHAFGVSGAAMAKLWAAFSSTLTVAHFRHEAGAAFAAAEAYFATGSPAVVFTTTGPGISNALTGVHAARDDGAKLVLITACTPAHQRGKWAIQETSSDAFPVADIVRPFVDYSVVMEHPAQFPQIARRLAHGLAEPGGFVAHVCIPSDVQSQTSLSGLPAELKVHSATEPNEQTVRECVELLRDGNFAIWLGFGAGASPSSIRELAERTRVPVMCSPRAKGIFPEDHPQFIGVTGLAGHASAAACIEALKPRHILVLGTRLGEPTAFGSQSLVPQDSFIHVDIDPEVPGTSYPNIKTIGVRADIQSFVAALLRHLPKVQKDRVAHFTRPERANIQGAQDRLVRPEFLMEKVNEHVVTASNAIVMAESGNSFTWATHLLRFNTPGRYRVSTGVGAMGHMTTGVVGAALARRAKAVAIVGDGAMLMNNEINTAVKYQAQAVWIVLNDGRYNMCHQGMAMLGLSGADATFPRVNFKLMAESLGAEGVQVRSELELDAALEHAMRSRQPFVIDVAIDPDRIAPSGARNRTLLAHIA